MTKPSLGQGVACIVGILSLQALLNWMDADTTEALLWSGRDSAIRD